MTLSVAGPQTISENIAREVINHKKLLHPNVVQFKEVRDSCIVQAVQCLSSVEFRGHFADGSVQTGLPDGNAPGDRARVRGGGELFNEVASNRRLPEDLARYFFQQIIIGLEYCHDNVGVACAPSRIEERYRWGIRELNQNRPLPCEQGVCHRDVKLENILVDNTPYKRVKICDFGCSKVMPLRLRVWGQAPAYARSR